MQDQSDVGDLEKETARAGSDQSAYYGRARRRNNATTRVGESILHPNYFG
jgi:hypothetical protein